MTQPPFPKSPTSTTRSGLPATDLADVAQVRASGAASPPMPVRAHGLRRALDLLAAANTLVAGCCLVLLIAIFGWLVFGRYVLNSTPTWAEQLGLLLIVYITFLSAAVGVHQETHLSVTLFRDMLPAGGRKVLLILSDVLLACFGVLMASQTWTLVLFGWSTKIPLLGIPEGVKSFALVTGGALIALFAGARALRRLLTPARDMCPALGGEEG